MSENVDVSAVLEHCRPYVKSQAGFLEVRSYDEALTAVAELVGVATELRTSLSLTRSNVMTEIKRGATQWDGVPELLQKRIDVFDAALARVKGA